MLGSFRVGGGLGENPVLLVGSMFYLGDKTVRNHSKGEFDKAEAKQRVEEALNITEKYSLPLALDPVASTPKAMRKYVEFLLEYEKPVFLDGVNEASRVEGYRVVSELGASNLAVVNSITIETSQRELEEIRNAKIKAAVLIDFDFSNPGETLFNMSKRLEILNKLLLKAEKAGVKTSLVDAVVLDPYSIALTGNAIEHLKQKGFIVGCAPGNALSKLPLELDSIDATTILTAALCFLRLKGADFLMYGPIKLVKYFASGIATLEALQKASVKPREKPRNHPLNKIMPILQKPFLTRKPE